MKRCRIVHVGTPDLLKMGRQPSHHHSEGNLTIFPFMSVLLGKNVASVTVLAPCWVQRVELKKSCFQGACAVCRAGDLDIALLNAVVSALSRAAQWQQARVKNDLRFVVPVVLVEKKSYPFLGI